MTRPTTRDLAKAAGVSLATVDRVLNDRPNVSSKAARKVLSAIEDIGFVRNIAAANLAKNTSYRFRFVLPERGDEYLAEILREVGASNQSLKAEPVSVDVAQVAVEDPHAVANHLASIKPEAIGGLAIMVPESPQVRDAINRLAEKGIKVVQFLSGKRRQSTADFVGVDNIKAGATAARLIGRFSCKRQGSVIVVSETMRAQDSIERRLGFDNILNADFPQLHALPSLETHADEDRTRRIIASTLKHNKDIIGLYVMSSEARVPLKSVTESADLQNLVTVVHERTPYNLEALRSGLVDAIIAQNPGHAVRSAIRLLRARLDNREPVEDQERLRIEILLKDNA